MAQHRITESQIDKMLKCIGELEADKQWLLAKYNELLYAVATKHPGESRHATALRYIEQAEMPSSNAPEANMSGQQDAEP